MPQAKPIEDYLSETNLDALRSAYRRADFYEALKNPLLQVYPHTKEYADAIEKYFYYREDPNNPNDDEFASPDPGFLTIRERELCLITLLTAQNGKYNLALHVYMALMEGLSPAAIVNTMFLAGIYAGVPFLAGGLETAIGTLVALQKRADTRADLSAGAIYDYLRTPFPFI